MSCNESKLVDSCFLWLQSVATRGWDIPNLQDVQAKSDALEASGFATVHSPLISKATQDAMAKQASKPRPLMHADLSP